ncbi:hypothetical protein AB5I41_11045 [Sphingomonas sp. MMS24-JH45]
MNVTTIDDVKLDLYGAAPTTNDVYSYTDEFFTMAAVKGEGARKTLVDGDCGIDWINAAAISSDVVLSLATGGGAGSAAKSVRDPARHRDRECGERRWRRHAVGEHDGQHPVRHARRRPPVWPRRCRHAERRRGQRLARRRQAQRRADRRHGERRVLLRQCEDVGVDRITDFGTGDRLVLTRALRDGNGDGIITFASDGVLRLDGTSGGDSIMDGVDPSAGLRYMGMEGGYYVYTLNDTAERDSSWLIARGTPGLSRARLRESMTMTRSCIPFSRQERRSCRGGLFRPASRHRSARAAGARRHASPACGAGTRRRRCSPRRATRRSRSVSSAKATG